MKVFELLNSTPTVMSESQIIERLKAFDWKYDFSENTSYVKRKEKELQVLENAVYQMWKQQPDKAVDIWNKYSADGVKSEKVTPSFIFRLEAQDI